MSPENERVALLRIIEDMEIAISHLENREFVAAAGVLWLASHRAEKLIGE